MTHRLAREADLPALRALMDLAIRHFISQHLDEAGVEASFAVMGLDSQLVEDGTYFVIERDGAIAGCGGWSRRATLYGGNHTHGRDARLLDPASEPARVRAMYTHPDFARRGVGREILELCEGAAKAEGFTAMELMATVSGEALYAAYGFEVVERFEDITPEGARNGGAQVPGARMRKDVG